LSAVELSRQLLHKFGTLSQLVQASKKEFCAGYGLGEAKFVQLQAVMEMSSRCLYQQISQQQSLCSAAASRTYLQSKLQHHQDEVFSVLFLDNQHHPLAFEELFHGTINSANVYPRVVVKRALHHNCAAVILAHNHPSGIAEPSQADISITHQLNQALAVIDVRLLDHFIIGHGEATSLAEKGLLN